MVDFGLFSGAIQLALVINEMARAAQSNKVSCMAMNHRIQIANEIIKVAFDQHKSNPKSVVISESAFKMYFQLLERMRDFIAEISKRKTFSKLFYALRFRDEFDALLRDFDSCVLDLNLGIALRTQAQLETDRSALEEDMVELRAFRKELQSGVECLGGQLMGIRQMIAQNRPMDDILSAVEIDYRQVIDITPGETRKGRTFPVHKRSWLAQEVAEKPLGYFGSKDMLDMLKSEVAILKKLDRCIYITRFIGVTNRNNHISIIMEWLPGGDLATALSKGGLEWDDKLYIAADIARGLHFLHEVGIIHKTLRAKNIMLTRFGQAKIANFRQSRLESAATRPMSDPFSYVRWLAPEKMTSRDVRYGAECDIFSFGMLLFEIAANKIPFIQYTDRELPELIVLKPLYETVPDGTPLEFSQIMTACWSHDPRMRPTVSQVLLVLRDACDKLKDGRENFGGLPTSMKNAAPLFNMSPATPKPGHAFPISPPVTPVNAKGMLTPEVWNNPYVNKRHLEDQAAAGSSPASSSSSSSSSPSSSLSPPSQQPPQSQPMLLVPPVQVQPPQPSPQPSQLPPPPQTQPPMPTPPKTQPNVQSQPLQSQPQSQPQSRPLQSQPHQIQTQSPRLSQQKMAQQAQQSPRLQNQQMSPQTQSPRLQSPSIQVTPGQKQEYQSTQVFPPPSSGGTLTSLRNSQPQSQSPVQSHAAAIGSTPGATGGPPSSQPRLDSINNNVPPPTVNRNTRPASNRTPSQKQLEAEMNRLSLQVNRTGSSGQNATWANNNTNYNNNNGGNNNNNGLRRDSMGTTTPTTPINHVVNGGGISVTFPQQRTNSMSPRTQPSTVAAPAATLSQALYLHEAGKRDEAWGIFKVLSDQRDPQGMYWVGYYYFHGYGGQGQDRRAAFDLLSVLTHMNLPVATHENRLLVANAHFYTAVCYLEGQGVPRDYATGFGHLERAADFGNAFAQFLVGDAYNRGSALVHADPERRNHYWRLAARQNEQRAIEQCTQLGIIF